jgi:glycosyltransferase involved in cell wall biosynthesis/SAM-dependent methyltransferase
MRMSYGRRSRYCADVPLPLLLHGRARVSQEMDGQAGDDPQPFGTWRDGLASGGSPPMGTGGVRMKVLHVVHFPVFGGPHNQALRLAAPLRARGFDTLVVVPSEEGNAAERLRAGDVDVLAIPLHRLRATSNPITHLRLVAGFPGDVRRLRGLIRAEGVDVVQIGGLMNPHAAIAARMEGVPIVWQLLDTRAPRLIALVAMAFVRELADVVMSTGVGVARSLPGYAAIADRLVPFFPPVDLDRFVARPDLRAAVRAEWGVPLDAVVVGCVANINPQKGIVDLVTAFAQARHGHADACLVLVGAEYATQARYSALVRAEMARHGLAERRDVVFAGERADVEHQLNGMDVVALAAARHSEGITTAVLEAMAAGLPVVVTDVGALREAIVNEESGLLVESGDTRAFAAGLARLLDDPMLRARMAVQGRVLAERRFGVEMCADVHVHAYARALARHGNARRVSGIGAPNRSIRAETPSRVVDGLPVYLDDLSAADHDELEHDHGRGHKVAQATHFDRLSERDFETTRPHGLPRLYRFLLMEKFRIAVRPIRSRLVGASALTVCGGSGMDAEFLARAGASVTSSNISLGAAGRVRERSQRYALDIQSIVADVEPLPYADASFDLVAVHDGLHHLDDPYAGLSEMARVARRWVLVSEPARASATRLAVRLGWALEVEGPGNRVARLDPNGVADFLEARGYAVLRAQRYAMYYPHHPGAAFALLSHPLVFPVVRAAWRAANAAVGRFGNKMVVVAERR